MRQVYNFLNLPFLKVKHQALLRAVKETEEDMKMAEQELDMLLGQDYDEFLEQARIRQSARGEDRQAARKSFSSASVLKDVGGSDNGKRDARVSKSVDVVRASDGSTNNTAAASTPSHSQTQQSQLPPKKPEEKSKRSNSIMSFFRKKLGRDNGEKERKQAEAAAEAEELRRIEEEQRKAKANRGAQKEESIDAFTAGNIDDSFFGDVGRPAPIEESESESDDEVKPR